MGPGDHVRRDQLSHAPGGFRTRIHRGLHAADISAHDGRYEGAADLDGLDHLDVGGFAHRIGRLDQSDPSLGFDQPNGGAVDSVAVSSVCHAMWHGRLARVSFSLFLLSTQSIREAGKRLGRRNQHCYFFAVSAIRPATGAPAPAGRLALGIIPPRSSCGRGMTWTLMTVPTRPADSAPASTAAFTAATSPFTKAVTMPLPALSHPIISTFAAFSIASLPSIRETRPLHSSRPSASCAMFRSFHFGLRIVD